MSRRRACKKLSILLLVTVFLLVNVTVYAAEKASPTVSVFVDDEEVVFPDQKPFIDSNNRTMIPLRFVAEKLEAEVEWVAEEKKVIVKKGLSEVNLFIGSPKVIVDGEEKQIDTVPVLVNGRTMVPLRFISEVLGWEVKWDGHANRVTVIKPKDKKYVYVFDKGKLLYDESGIIESFDLVGIEGDYAVCRIKIKKTADSNVIDEVKESILSPGRDFYWTTMWNVKSEKYDYNAHTFDRDITYDSQNSEVIVKVKLPPKREEKQTASCHLIHYGDKSDFGILFPAVEIEADPNAKEVGISNVTVKESKPGYVNLVMTLTRDPGFYVTARSLDVEMEVDGVIQKNFDHTDHFTYWDPKIPEFTIKDIKLPKPTNAPQKVVFIVTWPGCEPVRTAPYIVQPAQ